MINAIAFEYAPIKTKSAVLGHLLFLTMAVVLPMITHLFGFNFLVAQPMHWIVLFAGITYGPISGLLIGLAVPLMSTLLTGMPVPFMLPLMIPELMAYGFIAGSLKERVSAFASITMALIIGKLCFIGMMILLGRLDISITQFAINTWSMSGVTMIMQILALPILAGFYIKWINE